MTDFEHATKDMMQQIGDSIADALEQMNKGNWRDDQGYDVRQNAQMQRLAVTLNDMVGFRAEWFDMEDTREPSEADQGLIPIPDGYNEA